MAKLRHIYRSNKLTNIPQKRYARKYNRDYLKEKASHGASLKEGFGDFDGDGDLDGIYPKQRAGVAEKPGLYTNPPRRGPRNLAAFGLPQYGPTNLIVSPPESGPQNLTSSTALPQLGPTDLSTVIEASSVGPALLEASIIAPAAGPSNLGITNPPAAGPTSLNSSEVPQITIILQPWIEANDDVSPPQPQVGTPTGGSPPFYAKGDPQLKSYNSEGNFIYEAAAPTYVMMPNTHDAGYTRFDFVAWQHGVPGVINSSSNILRSEGPWPTNALTTTAKPIYAYLG